MDSICTASKCNNIVRNCNDASSIDDASTNYVGYGNDCDNNNCNIGKLRGKRVKYVLYGNELSSEEKELRRTIEIIIHKYNTYGLLLKLLDKKLDIRTQGNGNESEIKCRSLLRALVSYLDEITIIDKSASCSGTRHNEISNTSINRSGSNDLSLPTEEQKEMFVIESNNYSSSKDTSFKEGSNRVDKVISLIKNNSYIKLVSNVFYYECINLCEVLDTFKSANSIYDSDNSTSFNIPQFLFSNDKFNDNLNSFFTFLRLPIRSSKEEVDNRFNEIFNLMGNFSENMDKVKLQHMMNTLLELKQNICNFKDIQAYWIKTININSETKGELATIKSLLNMPVEMPNDYVEEFSRNIEKILDKNIYNYLPNDALEACDVIRNSRSHAEKVRKMNDIEEQQNRLREKEKRDKEMQEKELKLRVLEDYVNYILKNNFLLKSVFHSNVGEQPFYLLGFNPVDMDTSMLNSASRKLKSFMHPDRFPRQNKILQEKANEAFLLVKEAVQSCIEKLNNGHAKSCIAGEGAPYIKELRIFKAEQIFDNSHSYVKTDPTCNKPSEKFVPNNEVLYFMELQNESSYVGRIKCIFGMKKDEAKKLFKAILYVHRPTLHNKAPSGEVLPHVSHLSEKLEVLGNEIKVVKNLVEDDIQCFNILTGVVQPYEFLKPVQYYVGLQIISNSNFDSEMFIKGMPDSVQVSSIRWVPIRMTLPLPKSKRDAYSLLKSFRCAPFLACPEKLESFLDETNRSRFTKLQMIDCLLQYMEDARIWSSSI